MKFKEEQLNICIDGRWVFLSESLQKQVLGLIMDNVEKPKEYNSDDLTDALRYWGFEEDYKPKKQMLLDADSCIYDLRIQVTDLEQKNEQLEDLIAGRSSK